MTDQEIIAKSKRALDKLGITYDNEDIKVIHVDDKLLLEINENMKNEYVVMFKLRLPNDRDNIIAIHVDKKTHKLLYVITKFNHIPIPDELK
jgi:hypothetical protein